MTKTRVPVPSELAADVMFASDSTCCVCRERGKEVQIHHIDDDPANNTFQNLAILCLECHNKTQMRGGFGRSLNVQLVVRYRDEWLARVMQRRNDADRTAVAKMSGVSYTDVPWEQFDGRVEQMEYSDERMRMIHAYVNTLPGRRAELLRIARPKWGTGVTATMMNASYDYVQGLQGLLVALSRFYAEGTFGSDPHRFFSEVIASRYRWHRSYLEAYGPGTGGTIVGVDCGAKVARDAEMMVEDLSSSLLGYSGDFDWEAWRSRWRSV